jgi:hypothetical protein
MRSREQMGSETNLSNSLHQGLAVDLVLRDTDDGRGKVGSRREDGLDSLGTLEGSLQSATRVSFRMKVKESIGRRTRMRS